MRNASSFSLWFPENVKHKSSLLPSLFLLVYEVKDRQQRTFLSAFKMDSLEFILQAKRERVKSEDFV